MAMTKFRASLILAGPILFGAAFGYFVTRPGLSRVKQPRDAVPPAPATIREVVDAPVSLRWNEIESADYATYIRNLRAIGCPERTIRAIITGAIADFYDEKAGELETDPATVPNLRREQTELLAALFPPAQENAAPARQAVSSANPAEAGQAASVPPEKPPTMPLAFMEPGPDVQLTDDQRNALQNIRRSFIDSIGGPNQNPSDPQYLARWKQAQPDLDAQVHATLGDEIYSELQIRANHREPGR